MGNARNVGGIRARSGLRRRLTDTARPTQPEHYLTKREAAIIARAQTTKNEGRGIFRRWNDRKLTPEQAARATEALQRPPRPKRRRLAE